MIIGVTGLIGSGKSFVTDIFESLGAVRIDADLIGKEVVDTDPVVFYRLVLEFGKTILNSNYSLNRKELGKLAFSSKKNTELLNSIVHPALLERLDNRINLVRSTNSHAVVDAALLIHWKYYKNVDKTIVVTASKKVRTERLLTRGLTIEEVLQRSKSQLSLSELKRYSDIELSNNHSKENLRKKAIKLYRELTEKG
ncbi:MAG: dephospho-CoA kinase [candidate division Zixibacteria bacterium]|nr:dephospho-CoA kinase [candidate division Zixibacteria bacterium]